MRWRYYCGPQGHTFATMVDQDSGVMKSPVGPRTRGRAATPGTKGNHGRRELAPSLMCAVVTGAMTDLVVDLAALKYQSSAPLGTALELKKIGKYEGRKMIALTQDHPAE
jgi:hypothetical protein